VGIGLNKGDVEKDEEGLKTMEDLGKNIAWLMKQLKAPDASAHPSFFSNQ
jgi:multimeric flavodoxin WrbA